MQTKSLTLSDPRLLAEFVRQEEFKAFFEKRIEVPPDYMGLLMRNGQFVEAYKGAHFTIGGIAYHLKGLIGGSQAISLLIADLKTFQITSNFSAVTHDKLDIMGTASLEIQINPEKPQNIIGMMTARKALAKEDVAAHIRPHLADRVFEASISRVKSDEVRGNKGLQDMIQADVMREVERIAGDLGLLIRSVSIEWALNDVEKKEIQRAAALREAEAIEFDFDTMKRAMERETETTELKITSKLDVDKLNLESEDELKRLVLSQEITFIDARETGKRIQEMKVLAHEIDLMKTERLAKFDDELAQATHDGVDIKEIGERSRKIGRETEQLDTSHRLMLRSLERDYDAESRGLARKEDVSNRREDREDVKTVRKEDRDYDYDTRDKNLDIQGKEREFGFKTRREEVDVGDKEHQSQVERQRTQDKAARDKIKDLQDLDMDADRHRSDIRNKDADAQHKRDLEQARLDAQREIDRMQLGAKMTPEQMLALNAGLSPAVANVLVEQAKANSQNNAQQMDLMRQMVDQANRAKVESAEQAHAMFEKGIDGAVGGAAAAASKAPPITVAGMVHDDEADKIDCPKCGRTNTAKARFCVGCGEQLRK
jgi:hypothetical protein